MKRMILVTVLSMMLTALSAPAATYVVKADGSGDFPVIQAAVDGAVNGDVILLADGTFMGMGNSEVNFWGKAITIRSKSGRAVDCIIDPDGEIGVPRTAFLFESTEGPDSVIRDMTIVNGSTATSC